MMTILQVQCLLKYLGYNPGVLDGIWGGTTKAAVAQFQTDYGITADGYPGDNTDKALKHAVCYGMPEKKVADTSDSAEKNVADATTDESALQYIQSDGYYHIPKDKDIRLSKNFSSREFRCGLGRGCSCTTTLINPKLVDILQDMREHFDATVTITSAYRCPSYNSSVGGATGSRHTKGDAADITITGVTPRTVARYAEDSGVLGIGLYESSSDGFFTHTDTRDYKSFWYGQAQKGMTTFK